MMVPEGQAHGRGAQGLEAKGEARSSAARSRSPPRAREIEIIFNDDRKSEGASEGCLHSTGQVTIGPIPYRRYL